MEFYKQIFEDLPEGVAVCGPDQRIIDVNRNFEKISGFSKDELIGKHLPEVVRLTREACNVCQDEENDNYQIGELRDKNDKLTCIRINYSKTGENNTIYLVIPFSSIAFLNQAHLDFVSTVSHELRTPLTSIKGFTDTLLSAGSNLNQEQRTRFVSIIKSQVDRLTRLVENLLVVSRLEARQSKSIYKAVKIGCIVENVLYNLQHKSKNHKLNVNILPELPPVWADADKLEQVMMNLVDNALKYSNPGTTVDIYAGFSSNDTDTIEINVKDQGFGIPEKALSRVFSKFSRIDNPLTRQVQGTGLGLYITKSLVTGMKGDVSVKSSDKGSIFTVTLPAANPETAAKQKLRENS